VEGCFALVEGCQQIKKSLYTEDEFLMMLQNDTLMFYSSISYVLNRNVS
jgi:hypothetical protein